MKAAIPIVMPIGNVVANIGAEYEACEEKFLFFSIDLTTLH